LNSKMMYGVAIVILLGVSAYLYMDVTEPEAPRSLTALERVGDECELIAEKAAMALPEVLPFQKLEKPPENHVCYKLV